MEEVHDAITGDHRSHALWFLRPEFLEWMFTLAALAFLLAQAAGLHDTEFVRGAGERYQPAIGMRVPLGPEVAGTGRLANICTHFGGWLPEAERKPAGNFADGWRDSLLSLLPAKSREQPVTESAAGGAGVCDADSRHAIPKLGLEDAGPSVAATLTQTYNALVSAIAAPVTDKLARLAELENRAREARAETDVRGVMTDLDAETRAYRETYEITGGASGTATAPYSQSLACAWNYLQGSNQALAPDSTDPAVAADRVRLLAAMAALLDGDAARAEAGAMGSAQTAWSARATEAGCNALGTPQAVVHHASELVAKARASDQLAGKSAAMQGLLATAPWTFAAWSALGLLLLQIARRPFSTYVFLPLALFIWSVAGWAGRVHPEWIDDKSAHTLWLVKWGVRWPEAFYFTGAVSLLLLVAMLPLGRWLRPAAPPAQTPSSRIGYAGFVLFVGIGWWLLLDLSAEGYLSNRFHALYQQSYIFAAFVLLTTLPALRLQLAHRLSRWLGRLVLLARPRAGGFARLVPWLLYLGLAAVVLLFAALVHQRLTQLTSEIFRLWLVFGVSWFFLVRGDAALTLAQNGGRRWANLVFVLPLLFAVCVPLVGLVLTDDFGPLMVTLYAASIFVGAGVAFAFVDRAGYRPWLGAVTGITVAGAWVYLGTLAMFTLPAPAARIVERLASMRDPFTAANDQMAIVTWFQESAPPGGYGLGGIPWCGEALRASCHGVPRQIQSDYVYTALVGAFGKGGAIALVALLAFWLVRLVAQHGRATRGAVSLESAVATQQAWLSWIAVCWVGLTLAQLAITVAGNLGWLPLTGITFPFVSFGVWSLLVNTFFLSLAINLPRAAR